MGRRIKIKFLVFSLVIKEKMDQPDGLSSSYCHAATILTNPHSHGRFDCPY